MCIEDTRRHRRYPEQVCCSCPSNNEIYNISRSTHRIDQPIEQINPQINWKKKKQRNHSWTSWVVVETVHQNMLVRGWHIEHAGITWFPTSKNDRKDKKEKDSRTRKVCQSPPTQTYINKTLKNCVQTLSPPTQTYINKTLKNIIFSSKY